MSYVLMGIAGFLLGVSAPLWSRGWWLGMAGMSLAYIAGLVTYQ